jgi:hypothetical protein
MSLKRLEYGTIEAIEIMKEIQACNPELHACIEERATKMRASSGKEPTFFIAEYNYGENIIDSYGFEPPADSDIRVKQKLVSSISSNKKTPLILILSNSSEVYIETQMNTTKSLKLLVKGDLIGTYECIESMQQFSKFKPLSFDPIWMAVAGARSVFLPIRFRSRSAQDGMINLLEHNNLFESKELKEHGLLNNDDFRNKLKKDAFPIIKAISSIPELKCNWKTKVVVFPDEWFLNEPSNFSPFHKYIYDAAWDQASFSINLDVISSQLSSKIRFGSITDNQILLDLAQICLSKTFAHELLQSDDPQITGPLLLIQNFLQDNLEYRSLPPIIHPVNINAKMQVSDKMIGYYSTTFPGQLFSDESNTTAIDLTKSFFKSMDRILGQSELLKYLSDLCGYQVVLSCYGRKRKDDKLKSLDNRHIFNDLENQPDAEQIIDYDHHYLRACIKAEFTKQF